MISFTQKGNFNNLENYLGKLKRGINMNDLDKFGKRGVAALEASTPRDTGKTAESWYYEITKADGVITISFNNSNIVQGVPIAVILQYGHATGTGGWVQGVDYINPALRPIFEQLADDAWNYINDTRRK